MSKKQPVFVPAEEDSEVLSAPAETADRSGLGREMKIGLGVILVLLVILGGVLALKLSGPRDVAAAPENPAEEATASNNASSGTPLVTLPSQPTVMTATADSSVQPASGTLDSWTIAPEAAQVGTAAARASSPPSFMPRPAQAEPSPHYAGYGGQGAVSEPATQQPAVADAYTDTASSDPFLRQSTAPIAAAETAIAPSSQSPASQAAGAGFAPAWQTPSSAGASEANPLRTQVVAEADEASAEPPALPDVGTMQPAFVSDGTTAPEPASNASNAAVPNAMPAYGDSYSRSTYRESEPMATATMPTMTSSPAVASASSQPVGPSGNETYMIQPGDNYWLISERLYGTGAYFRALAEHNREKFPQENKLVVGETISVASAEQLTAKYPSLCPKPGHRDAAQQRARIVSTSTRLGGGKLYVVQEGDSLFDIAKFELGKASRWVEIYELNRDVLGRQFDYLTPGMQLVLPEDRPAGTVTQRSDQIYQR